MTEEMITDNKGSEYVVVNGKVTNFSVTWLKIETSRKESKVGLSEVLQETLQYFSVDGLSTAAQDADAEGGEEDYE